LVRFQFLLAKHGVSYTESSQLALFEFEALVELSVREERNNMEAMQASGMPRLGPKGR